MSDPSGLQEILKTIQLNAYMTFKHEIYGYNEYDRYRSIFNERNIKTWSRQNWLQGGTWEHKARRLEMEKTSNEALKLTEAGRGFHHIGDFLPPEELSKFITKVGFRRFLRIVLDFLIFLAEKGHNNFILKVSIKKALYWNVINFCTLLEAVGLRGLNA